MKYINIKEFREMGYLQEINRLFLHRLGLALEIQIDEEGNECLGGIWDYREDDEGIIYDLKNSCNDRKDRFKEKSEFIRQQLEKYDKVRKKNFGFTIECI